MTQRPTLKPLDCKIQSVCRFQCFSLHTFMFFAHFLNNGVGQILRNRIFATISSIIIDKLSQSSVIWILASEKTRLHPQLLTKLLLYQAAAGTSKNLVAFFTT